MKKTCLNLLTVSALFLAACQQSTPQMPMNGDRVPLTFTTDYFVESRTAMTGDGQVVWSEADRISLFDGTYNNEFVLEDGVGSSSASFVGEALPAAEYCALYPYSEQAEYADGKIRSTLPGEQTGGVSASFAPGLNPSVATAEGMTLQFRNVASLVLISLVDPDASRQVERITLSSENQALAGGYEVSLDALAEDSFEAVATDSSVTTVTWTPDATESPVEGPCCLVVLPGTYSVLNIRIDYNDGSSTETSVSDVVLEAGSGVNIPVDASIPPVADNSLYGRYMAGEAIQIGDLTIDLQTYGDALLIGAEDPCIDSNITKVFFVEPGVEVTYELSQLVSQLFIIGNDPEQRSSLTLKEGISLRSDLTTPGTENLVLHNMEVVADEVNFPTTADYPLMKSNQHSFDRILFDNCLFRLRDVDIFASFNNTADKTIEIFEVRNCIFELNDTGDQKCFLFQLIGTAPQMTEVIYANNVFYNPSTSTILKNFKLVHSTTTGSQIGQIDMQSNTFLNVQSISAGGLIDALDIPQVSARKNLVWSNLTMATVSNLFYLRNQPALTDIEENLLYKTDNTRNSNLFSLSGTVSAEYVYVKATTNPFEGVDFSESFAPVGEYAQYGVQF